MDNEIYYDEEDRIKGLLLYRKIIKVKNNTLYLDNGVKLEVIPNIGCPGCGAGDYSIVELNGCENAITNVEFECESINEDYNDTSYKIFVLAEDKRFKILQVDGSDGNGYYGSGYSIMVREKKPLE